MPALLERPKMTKTMYQALKRHILKEREHKRQAEQEQDAIEEQQRKELEMKKKKEQEDSQSLEQTKEQIAHLEKRLETLNQEKHELFSQLKKVLHQEDETRKRAQIKEQSELMSLQQATYPSHGMPPVSGHPVLIHTGPLTGRPQMYRPTTSIMTVPQVANVPLKRPRSPSPPPASGYQQHQYQDKSKQGSTLYSHGHQQEFKPGAFQQSAQPSQVTSFSQPVHTIPQAPTSYSVSKSPGKYNPPGQSAFSSYSSHYAQQQQKITDTFPAAYQIQRMQQPGYMASPHAASNIPLQQQLQHANEKAGFNEDKYKIQQQPIRGVASQQPGLLPHQPLQQAASGKPSIVTGLSGRSQALPTSSYQPTSSQASYPVQQPGSSGRAQYNPQQRFY